MAIMKVGAGYIKPFRAYFFVDTTPSNQNGAPKRHGMPARFNEEQIATGMEILQDDNAQTTKVIENGILYLIYDGIKYNVQGQPVK